jgi:hypothetical protein
MCNNYHQVVPKVEGIGLGFGRVAAVDVDGVWPGVAPMKNVPMCLIRGCVCQGNLISTCEDYYRYLIFLPIFNQNH